MLRWTRRKLWEFRYYAAAREHTVWSRASDMALLAALLLALPATWFYDANVSQIETRHSISGELTRNADGTYSARVVDARERVGDAGTSIDQLYGFFSIKADRLSRGLPVVTSSMTGAPVVEVRAYERVRELADVDLSIGAPIRVAINEALERSATPESLALVSLWDGGWTGVEPVYHGWIAGTFLWTVILFVGFSLLILVARVCHIVFWRHKARIEAALEAAGKCPNCRYDLRGRELAVRCPECGELQY